MDQDKACDFWKTVVDHGVELCELLDASPTDQGLQESLQRIGRIVQRLRDAVTDIDPLLTVEVDQVPAADSAVLRIAISCNHDPAGIEAVQALVAAAPPMPPRLQVCAFEQPIPTQLAHELGLIGIRGREIPLHHVRFLAKPSAVAPGTFDLACCVPAAAVSDLDQEKVPGALVAHIVLSMGIGELRVMTRVRSIGIAVTDQPPPGSLNAWDLVEVIDSTLAH
jgi:hypothetical protein